MSREITVKTYKYGNHLHYEWNGELLEANDNYIVILCRPERKLIHYTKGKEFTMKNWSIEVFSLKDWFTVSASIENGVSTEYYCNVAMPSVFEENIISFIDLDLDYVKNKNEEWKVVDEDEFYANSVKYSYPQELIEKAKNGLEDLIRRVEEKQFPFNNDITKFFEQIKNNV